MQNHQNKHRQSMVQVINLTVKYDDFTAVDNISFDVKPGEIFGFLGANGAGKTTTIRVLCGLLIPSQGKVIIDGIEITVSADDETGIDVKKRVGYMSQKFTLYNDLTINENLEFIASLRNLDYKAYLKRREVILDFISFRKPLNTFVRDLPSGIKQQVSLAASILHEPSIVFLDEPTAGVTPAMRANFWSLIRELAKLGKTVFVTTHYIDEAEQCERIALMRDGKIIALDSPMQLKKTAFGTELLELEPKDNLGYQTIQKLKENPAVQFLEPYGLRFHVAFNTDTDLNDIKNTLKKDFSIKTIIPSLEDVFIKLVEEKS